MPSPVMASTVPDASPISAVSPRVTRGRTRFPVTVPRSAVVGSHTHVPTADARVFPQGTAHVTDTGMVGPRDSVLGVDKDIIVARFKDGVPRRFEVAGGPVQFNSVIIDVDESSGRARSIERLDTLYEVE